MRILSLCDFTGIWSQPYREAGYEVVQVDLQHGADIRLFEFVSDVRGIIAQPPCTHFAGSGARWWASKGDKAIIEGLQLVDACLRFVAVCRPAWWVLENPVGRLTRWIGPWEHTYQPFEYALYADDPDGDAYTKRTCLWGNFTMPQKNPHPDGPIHGSKMHLLPPSDDRAAKRAQTPPGFARAFFEVNR